LAKDSVEFKRKGGGVYDALDSSRTLEIKSGNTPQEGEGTNGESGQEEKGKKLLRMETFISMRRVSH